MATSIAAAKRPDNVPTEMVYDYDLYEAPREIATAYQVDLARKIHAEAPDIFWSPRLGGFWVFTRADDIDVGQRNDDVFSMRDVILPAGASPQHNIPLEADGPEHIAYRGILQPVFMPDRILKLEREVRALAIELIESFKDRGYCEFVSEFSAVLPIVIFLKLAALPLTDKQGLMAWSDAAVHPAKQEDRVWGYGQMSGYIDRLVIEREHSDGDDVISIIMRAQVFGRDMTREERHSMILNVLLGGLDTVMATMGVIARFLAVSSEHRRQLREDSKLIPKAIDELMRYHGATATARVITQDTVYKGIHFKKDDRVLMQSMFHGQDDRRFPNADSVDFHRKDVRHAAFGQGKHRCIGAMLARLEIRIFIEEWLQRIPEFGIADSELPVIERGMVNSMRKLPLSWPVPA